MVTFGRGTVNRDLRHLNLNLPVLVEEDFTRPLGAPLGIVDLSSEPRGFGMLIEAEALHRSQILFQG